MTIANKVSIVCPAHNEETNVPLLFEQVKSVLEDEQVDFEFIVVDDGSTDSTLEVLLEIAGKDSRFGYVSLSRNFGHQAALRAGIEHAVGSCVVCMDADLQHPAELIPELIRQWSAGCDIVATRRKDNSTASWAKRVSSRAFYSLINFLGDNKVEPGSADFRLLDRRIVEILKQYKEADIFFRGLLPTLGFVETTVEYDPAQRASGESSYKLKQMAKLALNGIVSTSIKPLRLATILAMAIGLTSSVYSVYALYVSIVLGEGLPGWASTILAVSILGSIQLFTLGIIGEYLGQTLREVRQRPYYLVKATNIDSVNGAMRYTEQENL